MSGPLSLKEIEEAMRAAQLTPEEALAILSHRTEAGAQRLIKRAKKEMEIIEKYQERSAYFLEARRKGYQVIAGLDEVGRGPLAGPVTVACVVLDPDRPIYGLRDSKRLSAKRREELAEEIRENAFAFSVASFTEKQIDQLNILEATKQAMLLAVETLEVAPHFLLLDALELDTQIPQLAVIGGDDKCNEIAAASILAKVERDRYMQMMHERYPEYRFDKNKGYGTAEHLKALREHGPCPIHRRTFLGNLIKET
ncbi:MAG TPA: ribonuclease HII [Tissierellia bacterium]|nr:ribonuclease HII [Tissierellia bacterium]